MEYKYTGIILSKRDVGETDRIYTIYTFEMGKIRVLAKSVRRTKARLAGFLEPITQAEIFIAKTKGLGKITGSIVTNNFPHIKSDIESMKQVFYVFKLLERIISEQSQDEKISNLLRSYLEVMEDLSIEEIPKNENKKNILTLGFLFKFLGELGYQVEAGKCVHCGKKLIPKENYFSAQHGGVLCQDCVSGKNQKMSAHWRGTRPEKINDESIKFIRIFLKNKLANLPKIDATGKDVNQIKIIFSDFLGWVFGESGLAGKGFLW